MLRIHDNHLDMNDIVLLSTLVQLVNTIVQLMLMMINFCDIITTSTIGRVRCMSSLLLCHVLCTLFLLYKQNCN